MRNFYKSFAAKTYLLIFLSGLYAFTYYGQNERALKCRENDYSCRMGNYQRMFLDKCAEGGKKKDMNFIYDCAFIELTKIIEQNPNDSAAYLTRGSFFYAKKPEQAILDFRKALEIDEKNKFASILLASSYRRKGDNDEALKVLDKAIELDPTYANAYLNRGYIYSTKRDFDKALSDFNKQIELEPKDDSGYSARASVYFEQQNFEMAFADLNKAVELSPDNWYNYYNRGSYYWRQGEKAKADFNCQIAKEIKASGIDRREKFNGKYCSL